MEKNRKETESLNRDLLLRKPETMNNSEKEELEVLRKTVNKYYNSFTNEENMKKELKDKNEVLMSLRVKIADLEGKLKTASSSDEAERREDILKHIKPSGIRVFTPDESQLKLINEISRIDEILNTLGVDDANYHNLAMTKLKLQTNLDSLLLVNPELPDRSREDETYALKPLNENLDPKMSNISVDDCSGGDQYAEFEYFRATDSEYYDEDW